jgi:hypothetical protein
MIIIVELLLNDVSELNVFIVTSNIHILTRCEFLFVTNDRSSCLKLKSQSREDYFGVGWGVEFRALQ